MLQRLNDWLERDGNWIWGLAFAAFLIMFGQWLAR